MRIAIWVVLLSAGCAKVVKTEGFRATIDRASVPKLIGIYEGLGAPSCGRVSSAGSELRLAADGFELAATTDPGGPASVEVSIGDASYHSDLPGGSASILADNPGGRIIGSLSGTLVHTSAGTLVDGRPAPIRELHVELTFNLQPCP